jgi:MFS family permease
MCLGAGFVKNKIGLLVLRAIAGIGWSLVQFVRLSIGSILCCLTGAAFTIPSALALIIRLFPDPAEQSKALGFFGSAAGLGNGAIFPCMHIEFRLG